MAPFKSALILVSVHPIDQLSPFMSAIVQNPWL